MKDERRVVVTGLGAITPIGIGLDQTWEGLLAGKNGIARITHFDPLHHRSQMAGEVLDFHPVHWMDTKSARRMDRVMQFGLAASKMAVADAALDHDSYDKNRAGVIIGSGIGGSFTIEDGCKIYAQKGPRGTNPFFVSKVLVNMTACVVSIEHGFKGPLTALSVACSTGSNAVGDAFRIIQRGDADIMLAGASEACITPVAYAGFCATRSMSTRNDDPEHASRPFEKNRDGFVMGEGAGLAVLEEKDHAERRGARIYAELVGYGNTADAYHFTAPEPEGDGMIRVMQAALNDARLQPENIGYINAHGTSTVLNDRTEVLAIQRVFGEHAKNLKMSATKSMIGHLMAAAGAVEFVATIMSVYTGKIHPTINYDEPDPECPLDVVPNTAREAEFHAAMSNSFGFGGGNACLIVKRRGD
ncbi:MAG: beta-ketoacyl-ACP synthase II [Candidatus Hydrogenedentota bacterium]